MDFGDSMGLKPLTELVRLSALFAMYLLAAQVVTTADAARKVFLVVGLSGVLPGHRGARELLPTTRRRSPASTSCASAARSSTPSR